MQGVSDINADARSRLAKRLVPQLLVDPDRLRLGPDTIAWKSTSGGGYLCIGIGDAAAFLCALDSDRDLAHKVDEAEERFGVEPNQGGDRFLRRLSVALDVVKDGYDSTEPRDNHGRWTGEGATAMATTAAVADAPALDFSHIEWGSAAIAALRALAARVTAGPAVAFLGTIFIPTNRSTITDGELKDQPDISYRFDQGTGVLTLMTRRVDGSITVLLRSRAGEDGTFRDAGGDVIGYHLSSSLVLDAGALPGYRAASTGRHRAGDSAAARDDATKDKDEPKLCPDDVPDRSGWESRTERSLAYQEQITGLPRGLAVELNGVSFDGCRPSDGTMIEAKGPGFQWAMTDRDNWREFYEGVGKILEQARNQQIAAGTRGIEWYFAEKPVADYFRSAFRSRGYKIEIFYVPPVRK